jgi:hypothetical protein
MKTYIALLCSSLISAAGITYTSPLQTPEGITYSESLKVFLVGSLTRGDISTIDTNGKVTIIIPTIVPGYGTLGVKTDSAGNIFVVISDNSKFTSSGITAGAVAYVAKYTKEYKQVYLSKVPARTANFLNDLKVMASGEVLVTDSASSTVFKVSVTGECSTFAFLKDATFIDGIEGIKDYYLVSDIGTGRLYKLSASGIPSYVRGVDIGMDGIAFDGETLLGVNPTNYQVITSSDNFESAFVKSYPLPNQNSTGTSIVPYGKNQAAVSNAYEFNPNVTTYTIDFVSTVNRSVLSGGRKYTVDLLMWCITIPIFVW